MRSACVVAILFFVRIAIVAVPAAAAPAPIVRMSADRIAFYYDRFVLQAAGHVRIDAGNGGMLEADFFSMNVRANRFVVGGHVRAALGGATQTGLAMSMDLDANRSYLLTDGPVPERLAFADADLAHPQRDVDPPADAFELPVLVNPAATLARTAVIGERSFIRYGRCRVQVIGGAGIYVPLPSCYVNFGNDPDIAQSAFAGANVGGAIQFSGTANAASAVFFNYDATSGVYAALQQNLASDTSWLVVGLTISGHPSVSLVGATHTPGDGAGVRVSSFAQSLGQTNAQPLTGFTYSDLRAAGALPFGFAEFFGSAGTQSGSGPGYAPSRPLSAQVDLTSPRIALGPVAFATVEGGYGTQNNVDGLQTIGGVLYQTLYFSYAGLSLGVPAIPLGGGERAPTLSLSGSQTIQGFSVPHETTTTDAGASIAKPFGPFTFALGYSIANVADRYADQRAAYPVMTPANDPGYAAFEGFATFRTITLNASYAATPRLDLSLQARAHDDFPAPAQGVFPVVDAPPLGQNPYPYQLGAPPGDVTLAARVRINPQLSIDVQDTQYINAHGWPTNTFSFLIRP